MATPHGTSDHENGYVASSLVMKILVGMLTTLAISGVVGVVSIYGRVVALETRIEALTKQYSVHSETVEAKAVALESQLVSVEVRLAEINHHLHNGSGK